MPGQQRAAETRQRLLEAAARVFSDYGYAAGTTNRIAAAAGHSIGSLYQYFPNKDAILAELVAAHSRAGVEAIRARLAGPLPESLEDKVRLFVVAAIDSHRDDPALHRVLFEEAPRPPEVLAMLHAAELEARTAAETLLAADPSVRVTDIPMAARLVVSAIESLVHRVVTHDPPADLTTFENELVAMIVRYLTPPANPQPDRQDRREGDV